MIVLHAIWSSDSTLCIWGEDSSLAPRGRTVRQSKRRKPRAHPFACDRNRLTEAIGQLAGTLDHFVQAEPALLLPSSGDAPQASPQVFREDGSGREQVTGLTAWKVPALALSPNAALDALLSLPEGRPTGIAMGRSLSYFAEAAKLALEWVARGRVLPALVKRNQKFLALWRPVPDHEKDAERLRLLARAMPASCRAELVNGSTEGRQPDAIVNDLLGCLVDALVRLSIRGRSLAPSRQSRRAQHRSAEAAWLAALVEEHGIVDGEPSALITLQKTLAQWSRSAVAAAQASLRTCFRISPPAETADDKRRAVEAASASWQLEFLLQATDDKSLIVQAGAVWKTGGEAFTFLKRKLENPQERLLEDLGRATRLYPDLETALKTARPAILELDTNGAYRFLREAAPLLEQAGFGVLVPAWWGKSNARIGAKLKVTPKGQGGLSNSGLLGLDGICAYRWEIALGDEQLSFADFKKLSQLKVPLVKVRGLWVELKQEEIAAALAFFQKRETDGEMTVGEALRIGLGIEAAQVGLPVVGIEAKGWLSQIFGLTGEQRIELVTSLQGFAGTLRPYQERGLSWLAFLGNLGLGACLADDMGLGKTIQLLALLVSERAERKNAFSLTPTLLICPMSVVGNWQREAQRFAPMLKVHAHHGAERLSGKQFADVIGSSDLVITTYALAARDQKMLAEIEWRRIALDEAQNIKNSAAKQTQAIRSFKAGHRVALTGTPVENRLSELWSIMEFLNPGLLGSAADFRTRFATPIERYRDENQATLLKRVTGAFVLRRLKTDKSIIKDLPDKIEMKTFCNLTPEQASLYQAVVDEMLEKVEASEGIKRKGLVLATLLRLKQVCNHPAHLLQDGSSLDARSGKLARLEEILDEILAEGDKALLFTQFTEMGHLLKGHLQERFGREVLFLHGGTSRVARDAMVARFQQQMGPPIFLLSLKAGGTGLNLTSASQVIHFDRWWNPAVEDQATDRAFRIGQKKNVQVRKFICAGTLEERIDQMIEQKKGLAERIVGAGEAWLTELSTDNLRKIITLSSDAVSEDLSGGRRKGAKPRMQRNER
jgi:SNF2-related domain/SNF2 Helicase protein/Helicase conserved C-terminal domain